MNAGLFQIVWFACVLGGAKGLLWPAIVSFAVLAIWQLPAKRRHSSDLKLLVAAIVLGLIFDSLWVQLGFLNYVEQRPLSMLAPAWIIILWMGFALTINHSLTWMNSHPLLPLFLGAVCGPTSYLAGMKLGAVEYQADMVLISACLAVSWGFSVWFLVHLSLEKAMIKQSKTLVSN